MVDYHTHILPGIDDGSPDINTTIAMLKMEKDQGITKVIATPHFYAHKTSINAFLEKRNNALEQVRSKYLPDIIPAAEVYFFTGISNSEIEKLCVEGTKILLLEMPFAQWTDSMFKEVSALIHKKGLTVILAHVERYKKYQKDTRVWDKMLDLDLIVQINAESFYKPEGIKGFFKRKAYLDIIDGRKWIVATDCHGIDHRKPEYKRARAVLIRFLGCEKVEEMEQFAEDTFRSDSCNSTSIRKNSPTS